MSHELRIERLFDAPPELVFDTFVDPGAQQELFAGGGPEGWILRESRIDLRVGGTWTTVIGPADGEPDRITSIFTEIERPRRLAFTYSMYESEWGRTVDTEVAMTFEDQDGKTLLTMVQTGFEREDDRDAYLTGWPGFFDSFQRAVSARVG